MKVVIDVSENRYKDIQRIASVQLNDSRFKTAEQIIANGIPLPKGHGRLIDESDLILCNIDFYDPSCVYDVQQVIYDAPTIIPADKSEDDKSHPFADDVMMGNGKEDKDANSN